MHNLKNWNGCERPHRKVFEGAYVRLEPLDAKLHGSGLYEVVTADDAKQRFLWLPEYRPESEAAFQPWLEKAQASPDPMYFAVIDKASGRIGGRQTMMRMDPANGVAEIGHIYWGSRIARKAAATEAFFLFARHLFDELGYRRFEWKCNNANAGSKQAAIRFGMTPEGVFRQALVTKGKNRDTAWFSILDHEWNVAGGAFRQWLDPSNFDANGMQLRRLEDIRDSIYVKKRD